jgi:hypothetical protein
MLVITRGQWHSGYLQIKWLMLLVLQALSAAPSHLHSIEHFVESIHHELESFQSTSFAHCRRDANGWLILLHKKLLLTI